MNGLASVFSPSQFTPARFSSAEDKARFANHFVRFVASDFKRTLFFDWFYRRLSMTFGHIAHYSGDGFYGTFFTSTRDKVRFIECTLHPWTGFAGDPAFTYSDVERAIAAWLAGSIYPALYADKLAREEREGDLAELERLKAKYPEAK